MAATTTDSNGTTPAQNSPWILTPMKIPTKTPPEEKHIQLPLPSPSSLPSEVPVFDDPSEVPWRHFGICTVILDLDETLVSARGMSTIMFRPYARELVDALASVRDHKGRRAIEIVVWSAGSKEYVIACVNALNRTPTAEDRTITYAIYADEKSKWTRTTPPLKYIAELSSQQDPPSHLQAIFEKLPYTPSMNLLQAILEVKERTITRSTTRERSPSPQPRGSTTEPRKLNMYDLPFFARGGGRVGSSILVDDLPYAMAGNGASTLLITEFHQTNSTATEDTTLLYLVHTLVRASHCLSHLIHQQNPAYLKGMGNPLDLGDIRYLAALRAIEAGHEVPASARRAARTGAQHQTSVLLDRKLANNPTITTLRALLSNPFPTAEEIVATTMAAEFPALGPLGEVHTPAIRPIIRTVIPQLLPPGGTCSRLGFSEITRNMERCPHPVVIPTKSGTCEMHTCPTCFADKPARHTICASESCIRALGKCIARECQYPATTTTGLCNEVHLCKGCLTEELSPHHPCKRCHPNSAFLSDFIGDHPYVKVAWVQAPTRKFYAYQLDLDPTALEKKETDFRIKRRALREALAATAAPPQ